MKHLVKILLFLLLQIFIFLIVIEAEAQTYIGSWNPILFPNTGGSGYCGWQAQDAVNNGTISQPFASWDAGWNQVSSMTIKSNQTIYFKSDGYVQNYNYDGLSGIDNCIGASLDAGAIFTSAYQGLTITGSTSGCGTFIDARGETGNAIKLATFNSVDNVTISNIYFKGFAQVFEIVDCQNMVFNNCVFDANNYGTVAIDGILITAASRNVTVTFNNCKFVDNTKNTTTNAIKIRTTSATSTVFATVQFNNTVFTCNSKDNSGGAVMVTGRTAGNNPTIVNFSGCIFANNKATDGSGGAVFYGANTTGTIDNCSFYGNSVDSDGSNATSGSNTGGGALYIEGTNTVGAQVTVSNCKFKGNFVTGENGGAITLKGAGVSPFLTSLTVTGTVFESNQSGGGGAVSATYASLTINNSLFISNASSGAGGAIYLENITTGITFNNSTINSTNTSTGLGSAIYTGSVFDATGMGVSINATNFDITNAVNDNSSGSVRGAGLINSLLIDNFNNGGVTNNTVGNGWTELESTGSTGNRISIGHATISGAANQLVMNSGATAGREWCYRAAPSGMVTAGITDNTGKLTWAFNMKQSRSTLGGFDAGSYGIGIVLGCTSTDITTGNGYALVLGNSTASAATNRTPRLVKFTGGLDANANLTNVISGVSLTNAFDYLSIRVEYNAATDEWKLFQESGAVTYPRTDPRLTATQVGTTTVDATYTTSTNNLANWGAIYNHSNGAAGSNYTFYDDIYFQNFSSGTGSSLVYVSPDVSAYACGVYCAAEVPGPCISNGRSLYVCTAPGATGSVSGIVFNDSDADGSNLGESGISSVYVLLMNSNDEVIGHGNTNASGFYSFSDLPNGIYHIVFALSVPQNTSNPYVSFFQKSGVPQNENSDVDTLLFVSPNFEINTSQPSGSNLAVPSSSFLNVDAGFHNVLLPVELIYFNASNRNCDENVLEWSTASELNNDYFEVLRSIDGAEYSRIGFVQGNGTTSLTQNYEFIDKGYLKSAYYKLKQVDYNGVYEYSPIRFVKSNCKENTELIYTLSDGQLNIIFKNKMGESGRFAVIDINGRVVIEKRYHVRDSYHVEEINIDLLSKGVYFSKTVNDIDQRVEIQKIIIK